MSRVAGLVCAALLAGCGRHAATVRGTTCNVYEQAVRACRMLPEDCPWSGD